MHAPLDVHSNTNCSERSYYFFVLFNSTDSAIATAVNAQQSPQVFWSFIELMIPCVLQSILSGAASLGPNYNDD